MTRERRSHTPTDGRTESDYAKNAKYATIYFPSLFLHLRALNFDSHFFIHPIGLLLWVRVFRTVLQKGVGIGHIPFTKSIKLYSCCVTLSSSKLGSYLTLNVGKRGEPEQILTLPVSFLAYRESGWLYKLYTPWWVTPVPPVAALCCCICPNNLVSSSSPANSHSFLVYRLDLGRSWNYRVIPSRSWINNLPYGCRVKWDIWGYTLDDSDKDETESVLRDRKR